MIRCYVGLGSNLENPLDQVGRAVEALAQLPETTLVAVSPWYRSTAVGPGSQPDYINGVAALDTQLPPLTLLAELQAIERRQGRVRELRWGARTLDLDLLLYGDQTFNLPTLTVPHPSMHERLFVLRPLLDLAPELISPDGIAFKQLAAQLGDAGLWLVSDDSCPTIGDASGATGAEYNRPPNAGDKL